MCHHSRAQFRRHFAAERRGRILNQMGPALCPRSHHDICVLLARLRAQLSGPGSSDRVRATYSSQPECSGHGNVHILLSRPGLVQAAPRRRSR